MNTLPEVGLSTPPSICRSVDFPLPEGPITETNSPFLTENDTPSRADSGECRDSSTRRGVPKSSSKPSVEKRLEDNKRKLERESKKQKDRTRDKSRSKQKSKPKAKER